jgi:hypothetical protein
MILRAFAAALLCLAACGSDLDFAGTYETTPESYRRAFEETWPQGTSPTIESLRARFEQAAAANLVVRLELGADHRFSLVMKLPLAPEARLAGTWKRTGNDLELQVEGPVPVTHHGTLEGGNVVLQTAANAPRFVLQRKAG